jgi:predicted ATPase with chaperone activity
LGVRLLSLPNSRGTSPDRLLDRIDIHVEVSLVGYGKLDGDRMGETSKSIRKRKQAACNIQQQRFANSQSDIICNADMRFGGDTTVLQVAG